MPSGCQHFSRECKIHTSCCDVDVWCQQCHDDMRICKDRKMQVNGIICTQCDTRQKPSKKCINDKCAIQFSKFYCSECGVWDNENRHCGVCGYCTRREYTHCNKCKKCYLVIPNTTHVCFSKLPSNVTKCFSCRQQFKPISSASIILSKCKSNYYHAECVQSSLYDTSDSTEHDFMKLHSIENPFPSTEFSSLKEEWNGCVVNLICAADSTKKAVTQVKLTLNDQSYTIISGGYKIKDGKYCWDVLEDTLTVTYEDKKFKYPNDIIIHFEVCEGDRVCTPDMSRFGTIIEGSWNSYQITPKKISVLWDRSHRLTVCEYGDQGRLDFIKQPMKPSPQILYPKCDTFPVIDENVKTCVGRGLLFACFPLKRYSYQFLPPGWEIATHVTPFEEELFKENWNETAALASGRYAASNTPVTILSTLDVVNENNPDCKLRSYATDTDSVDLVLQTTSVRWHPVSEYLMSTDFVRAKHIKTGVFERRRITEKDIEILKSGNSDYTYEELNCNFYLRTHQDASSIIPGSNVAVPCTCFKPISKIVVTLPDSDTVSETCQVCWKKMIDRSEIIYSKEDKEGKTKAYCHQCSPCIKVGIIPEFKDGEYANFSRLSKSASALKEQNIVSHDLYGFSATLSPVGYYTLLEPLAGIPPVKFIPLSEMNKTTKIEDNFLLLNEHVSKDMGAPMMCTDSGILSFEIHFCDDNVRDVKLGFCSSDRYLSSLNETCLYNCRIGEVIANDVPASISSPTKPLSRTKITCVANLNEKVIYFTVDGEETKAISTTDVFKSRRPILFPLIVGTSCNISYSFNTLELLRTTDRYLCCVKPEELTLRCGPWKIGTHIAFMCPTKRELISAVVRVPPLDGFIVIQVIGETCLQSVSMKNAVPVTVINKDGRPNVNVDSNGRLSTVSSLGTIYCGGISLISTEGYCVESSPCWDCISRSCSKDVICDASETALSSSIHGKAKRFLKNSIFSKIERTFEFQTPLEYLPHSGNQQPVKCLCLHRDGTYYSVVTVPEGKILKHIPSALLRESTIYAKGDLVINIKTAKTLISEKGLLSLHGVTVKPITVLDVKRGPNGVLCQIQTNDRLGWVSERQLLPATNLLFTKNNEDRFTWFNSTTEQYNCYFNGTCGNDEACRSCSALTMCVYPPSGGFSKSSKGVKISFGESDSTPVEAPAPVGDSEFWECTACTFHNDVDATKCSVCETKPDSKETVPPPTKDLPEKDSDDQIILSIGMRVYLIDEKCYGWVKTIPSSSSYSGLTKVALDSGEQRSVPKLNLRVVTTRASMLYDFSIENVIGSRVLYQTSSSDNKINSGIATSIIKGDPETEDIIEINGNHKIKTTSIIQSLPPIPLRSTVLIISGEHSGESGTVIRFIDTTERFLIDISKSPDEIIIINVPYVLLSKCGDRLDAWMIPTSEGIYSITNSGILSRKTSDRWNCLNCFGKSSCEGCSSISNCRYSLGSKVAAKALDGTCADAFIISLKPENCYLVWNKLFIAVYQESSLRLHSPSEVKQFEESFIYSALWNATCVYHQVYDVVSCGKKTVPEMQKRPSSVSSIATNIANWSSGLLFRNKITDESESDLGFCLSGKTLACHPANLILQYIGSQEVEFPLVCRSWATVTQQTNLDYDAVGKARGTLDSYSDRLRSLKISCSDFLTANKSKWKGTLDTLWLTGSEDEESQSILEILGGCSSLKDDISDKFTTKKNDLSEIEEDYDTLVTHLIAESVRQCGRDRPTDPVKYLKDYFSRIDGFRVNAKCRPATDFETKDEELSLEPISNNVSFYALEDLTFSDFIDDDRSISPVDERILNLPNLVSLSLKNVNLTMSEIENIVKYGQRLTCLSVDVESHDVTFMPTFLKEIEKIGMPNLETLCMEYENIKASEVKQLAQSLPQLLKISLKGTCTDESDVSMAEALGLFREATGIYFSHDTEFGIKPCSCYRDFAQDAAMLATLPKCEEYIVPWEVLPGLRFVEDASRICDLRCTVGPSSVSDCLVMLGNLTTIELHGFNPCSEDEFCLIFENNKQIFNIDLGIRPQAMKYVNSKTMRRISECKNDFLEKIGLFSSVLSDDSWFPFSSSSLITLALSKPSFSNLVLSHSLVSNYVLYFLASALQSDIVITHCPYVSVDVITMLRRIPRCSIIFRSDVVESSEEFINGVSIEHQDPSSEQ